jgi:hypothetical protein
MTPDQAWSYLRDFAQQIGTPPHLMTGFDTWFDATAAEMAATPAPEAEQPAEPAQAQPATKPPPPSPESAAAPARPSPAAPTREALQQEIARWEGAMRAPEGSAEWNSYWREGGSSA